MTNGQGWRSIVASSLAWEEAHAKLESATKGLSSQLRGRRPQNYPHSVWELVEHIRLTQRDLLEFCRNPNYAELKWPEDYWPKSVAPPSDKAWDESIAVFGRDRDQLARFATDADVDLTTRIPHGTGQTYLRTILVAVDHTAYHVGQIISVRRLLNAWPM